MFKRMMAVGLGLSLLGLVAFTPGCSDDDNGSNNGGGGGGSCTAKSKCSNDPEPSQQDIDQCKQASEDPNCGAQYKALLSCTQTNQKCGSDGKTDSQATSQACAKEAGDYVTCAFGGGGGGGGG